LKFLNKRCKIKFAKKGVKVMIGLYIILIILIVPLSLSVFFRKTMPDTYKKYMDRRFENLKLKEEQKDML